MDRGIENQPLGSRLDALLRDFENDSDEPEETFDYAAFARRRQFEAEESEEESVVTANPQPTEEPVSQPAEVQPVDTQPEVQPETQLETQPETQPVEAELVEAQPEAQPEAEPEQPVDHPVPAKHAQPVERQDESLRQEMYAELGMVPPSPTKPVSQGSAKKPTKKAMQEMAQANQRYERQMDLEIGTKTKGSATVDSFLAMLDDTSEPHTSPPTSPGTPRPTKHNMLLSSPPAAQRLASFVRRSIDHTASNDDSDLEIVPESAKQRTSRPLRQMLSFARGAPSKVPAVNLLATLHDQLRKQTVSARASKIKELQERGIEVRTEQEIVQQNEEVETLLEREQRAADELRQLEKGDADRAFDDSDVEAVADSASDAEIELSGSDDSDEESDAEDDLATRRVAVLSDSEDEAEDEAEDEDEDEDEDDADSDAETQQTESLGAPIGRRAAAESTQVIEEPNQDVLKRLQAQAQAIAAETEAARSPSLSPLASPEPLDSPSLSPLAPPYSTMEPDLSDLKNVALSASQEMRELRRRYERAHANDLAIPFVEEEAQESDDEWAGLGGRSDEEADGSDIEGLVDDAKLRVDEKQLQQFHLDQEKERDLELVNRLVDDVHGGFRHKRAGRGLLDGMSDEESDGEAAERRDAREKRKRSKMLSESTVVAKLAANQRTRAFIETIAEDISLRPARPAARLATSVQETLLFLRPDNDADEPEEAAPVPLEKALPRTTITVRSGRRSSAAPASRLASSRTAEGEGVRSVEIVRSLHAAAQPKSRRVPKLQPPREPPRKPIVTASKAADRLFQRTWS